MDAELQVLNSKENSLEGFVPFAPWVPKPYPHREANFLRQCYMRGDNYMVQTP